MSTNLLKVKDLVISLTESGQTLVRNINFTVESGGRLILLGQSGSGKTMLCRALLGLLNPCTFKVSGSAEFVGQQLLSLQSKSRKDIYGKRISFIPQNPMTALDPSRKIGHQIIEFIKISENTNKADIIENYRTALAETGLDDYKRILASYPYQLSGGMLQRVLIAMALARKAELIIADEPTTALDAIHRDKITELLCRIQKQGCALLFVTHDFHAATQIGGEVIIMRNGDMIEHGDIGQVLYNPEASYTKELICASRLEWSVPNA